MLGPNSPNFSYHFSKYKSCRPQILHYSSMLWHITALPFLASSYSFNKSSTSKFRFSDLLLLALKFTKLLMSFLETRVSFCWNFASLSSVMRHNSFVFFHLKRYVLLIKGAHPSAKFHISTARMKIDKIRYVIFQVLSQFSFKFGITLQCNDT